MVSLSHIYPFLFLQKIVGQKYLFGKATLEELEESFNPDGMEPPDHLRILPPKIDPQNKIIPNASEKIKIKTMQGNKSGIFATANIKPGNLTINIKNFNLP